MLVLYREFLGVCMSVKNLNLKVALKLAISVLLLNKHVLLGNT